jgi:hypothetical protein
MKRVASSPGVKIILKQRTLPYVLHQSGLARAKFALYPEEPIVITKPFRKIWTMSDHIIWISPRLQSPPKGLLVGYLDLRLPILDFGKA